MTTYTDNFNLEKYQNGDAANLNDQYNASMDIIDTNLYKINTNASTASNKATQALQTVQTTNNNLTALGVTDTNTATSAKTKWDNAATQTANNKNDITAINNNLNALHANSVADATALHNIIIKPRIANPYHSKIVCIGDSYGQGYKSTNESQNNPYAVMGRTLNATIYNYSDGGAGWIKKSNNQHTNYNDQINLASTSVNNTDEIDYIMITGGQNDTENVTSAVVTTLANAHTKFPNAQIVVYPCQWPAYQIWESLLKRYYEIQLGVTKSGYARFAEYGYELNLGEWQYISDDNIHPNDTGYTVMGTKFASVLQGGYGGNTKIIQPLSYGANVTGTPKDLAILDHGTLNVQMHLTIKTSLTASSTLATLPKFIVINDTTTMYKYCANNKNETPKLIGFRNPDRNNDGTIFTPYGVENLELFISFTQHV